MKVKQSKRRTRSASHSQKCDSFIPKLAVEGEEGLSEIREEMEMARGSVVVAVACLAVCLLGVTAQDEVFDFTMYWAPTFCPNGTNDEVAEGLCPPNIGKGYPLKFLAIDNMTKEECEEADSEMCQKAENVTKLVVNGPGSVFGLGLGSELNMSIFEQAFPNNTALFGCKSCDLATVDMCLERNEDGSPGFAVPCPEGHDGLQLLETEDCSSCESIKIPAFEGQNITAQLQERLDDTFQNFQELMSNATSKAKSTWSTLQDQLSNATQGIADNFSNITSAQDLGDAAKGAFGDVKDIANDIGSAAKEGFNELKDGVQNIFG